VPAHPYRGDPPPRPVVPVRRSRRSRRRLRRLWRPRRLRRHEVGRRSPRRKLVATCHKKIPDARSGGPRGRTNQAERYSVPWRRNHDRSRSTPHCGRDGSV
jgi:hypothetical protein